MRSCTVYRGPFRGEAKVTPEEARKEPKMLYSCLTANTAEEYEAEQERLKADVQNEAT